MLGVTVNLVEHQNVRPGVPDHLGRRHRLRIQPGSSAVDGRQSGSTEFLDIEGRNPDRRRTFAIRSIGSVTRACGKRRKAPQS